MFELISADNFEAKVLEEKRPVLLAYIRRDYEFKKQAEVLRNVSKMYDNELKVYQLDENSIGLIRMLDIAGDPTFLIFHEGEEKERILGKANNETLSAFVLRNIQNFKHDNEA